VANSGRIRLSWVTALTVASLLVGSGAINALADPRDGNGHGDEHAQNVNNGSDNGHGHKTPTMTPTPSGAATMTPTPTVTPTANPTEVEDEDRPGLGCGDDNHVHTGPPGNPDAQCSAESDTDDNMAASVSDDDGGS